MRILLIDGSPRPKESTSAFFADKLTEKLDGKNEIFRCKPGTVPSTADLEKTAKSDVYVFIFPLYVDGLPAHLLSWISLLPKREKPASVYAIINNGYYDPQQNRWAADMLKNWCAKSLNNWKYAILAGGGPIAQAAPLGHGPAKNIGIAIENFVLDISENKGGENRLVKPNFPRFLYLFIANQSWKTQAKTMGALPKDLYAKRFYPTK